MITVQFYNGKEKFEDAFSVRKAVFMDEQGFLNEEDELDSSCIHCVLYEEDKPIATGRTFQDESQHWIIGRIAVLQEYRSLHLGKRVMNEIEAKLQEMKISEVQLSAQVQAKGFYEKLGYTAVGDIYYDEHCPHITMKKVI